MPDQLAGDLLAVLAESKAPNPCKLCTAVEQLSPADKEALSKVFASGIGIERIQTILARHGIPVGRPTLLKHRRDEH